MTRRTARISSSAVLTLALLVPHRAFGAGPAQAPAPTSDPFTQAPPPAEPGKAGEASIVRVEGDEDEVVLVDGSVVRGRIVEVAKGSHLMLSQAGELRRIAWAELQEVRMAMGATAPATVPMEWNASSTTPARAAARDEGSASPDPGRPRVHIESSGDRPVTLYEVSAGFAGSSSDGAVSGVFYRPVCTGTCDVVVDGSRGNEYFVGGTGVTASKPFTLAGDSGELTLVVRPGRPAANVIGFVATIVGGSAAAVGLGFAAFRSMREGIPGTLVTMAVTGTILTAVGIPLLLRGRTKVAKRRW